MLALETLTFATPWALAALALLPVIWWLLRFTPPRPESDRRRHLRRDALSARRSLSTRPASGARPAGWTDEQEHVRSTRASELLHGESMLELLREASERFECVVIDTPPLIAV